MATTYIKDPNAVLDYAFNWTDWLANGETISSYTVTVSTGITKASDTQANGIVVAWLSGGTAGQTYTATCRIVTNGGRTDDRTVSIQVEER